MLWVEVTGCEYLMTSVLRAGNHFSRQTSPTPPIQPGLNLQENDLFQNLTNIIVFGVRLRSSSKVAGSYGLSSRTRRDRGVDDIGAGEWY